MANSCQQCSHENPLGSNFCASCGQGLADPGPSMATQLIDLNKPEISSGSEAAQGMLVVRQGSKRGSRISLDSGLTTIGRHPESDIFLNDVTVSRRHAEIRRGELGFTVIDAGSLNGTYVDRQRVESQLLDDGCELQVGKFKLVFVSLVVDE